MSEVDEEKGFSEKTKFIIELIIMIVAGFLVILPLALYGYHFFI